MLFVGTVFFPFGLCEEVWGRRHLLIMHVLLLSGEYSSQITEMQLARALQEQGKKTPTASFSCPQSIYKQQQGEQGPVRAGI